MQPAALLVPLALGAAAVLQATLNRHVAAAWGLAPACVLNMLVALALAAVFVGAALGGRIDGELGRASLQLASMRWWWIVPGILGFSLVAGLPWAVAKLGALPVFVAVVGAQMVTSLAWDAVAEGVSVTPTRILGGLLAVASVWLVSLK